MRALLPARAGTPRRQALARLALLALAPLAGPAAAHSARVGALRIAHPHAPPTPGGVQVGAVYFKALHNEGREADQLLGASTPVAAAVEIHRMELDGDRMRMRRVESLALPAGTRLSLRPGEPGHHLMLLGLKRPLQVGDKLPLTLRFARAGTLTVEVWVEAPAPGAPDPHAGHGDHGPR